VPSRKEIQWSQLKVGSLIVAGAAILIFLIFLMSGSTGGLFSKKLIVRTYFTGASGLKKGAPVTIEDVTVGNVSSIRLVPSHNPTPVEITLRIGGSSASMVHTDSIAAIAQSGVLGDSYVNITSAHAIGPEPKNNAEIPARTVSTIQQVVDTSQDALQQASTLMKKASTLVDALNSGEGTAGKLIHDPELYNHLTKLSANLESVTQSISKGNGTLGKLVKDDTLYTKLNATVDQLHEVATGLNEGKGTAGKLLKDETLYNNLNASMANLNKLLTGVNNGEGSLGKLAKDPKLAKQLDGAVTNLNSLLSGINDGKGTIGQLAVNRSAYDNLNATLGESKQLIQAIRENPKKYLVIHLKLF
jgi:phospholipid/cholesterol/gamma-HCH transport system substrate-binding protein